MSAPESQVEGCEDRTDPSTWDDPNIISAPWDDAPVIEED